VRFAFTSRKSMTDLKITWSIGREKTLRAVEAVTIFKAYTGCHRDRSPEMSACRPLTDIERAKSI
jgi:hypothetical protein